MTKTKTKTKTTAATHTTIRLYDRVRLDDGRIGTIVYDDGGVYQPLVCLIDHGAQCEWLNRDDKHVIEVIGHRYSADTPFIIGETYETEGGLSKFKVVGVGLVVKSASSGLRAYRYLNGRGHGKGRELNLVLPEPEPEPEPPCEDMILEMKGKKYRLTLLEDE